MLFFIYFYMSIVYYIELFIINVILLNLIYEMFVYQFQLIGINLLRTPWNTHKFIQEVSQLIRKNV